jgi:hypothetical protein
MTNKPALLVFYGLIIASVTSIDRVASFPRCVAHVAHWLMSQRCASWRRAIVCAEN